KLFIPEDKVRISFSNLRLPTLIFGSMIAIVISAILVRNKKFINVLPILLILIVAFDLLRFAIKWQPFEPRKFVYPELPISKFLSTIAPYDRIFGNFGAEVSASYRASIIEGYDPLYIARYGEFIGGASDGQFHKAQRSGVVFPKRGDNTQDVLNFLGVKYIIHKIADGRYAWAYPFWEYPVDYFTPVYKDTSYEVYQNQKVFPRVLVVGKYRVESSNQKLLSMMFDKDSNLKEEAFLEESIDREISSEARGEAAVKSYKPNEIIIEASSSRRAILVLTDPFYPGWKALVDGSIEKIYRADYAFRGVIIPEGKHTVRFIYEPDSFKYGLALGLLGLLGTGGMVLYLRRI
ncbi:MAG: YfhO family protein, partial [Candidatus Levybacteria bacterium]|nr:YfhO family protein [Candidatus Levybacteria bacterium]